MRPKIKYTVIYRHRDEYSISVMCKFFEVSRSGYYDFVKRMGRPEHDAELAEQIKECQSKTDNTYGYRRVWKWLSKVLEDSVITKEESEFITAAIGEMLNPVEVLRTQVNSVEGRSVCLSGNFAYGSKAEVEEYIVSHGGTIDKGVKKTTGILLIGDCECQAYSNGTYTRHQHHIRFDKY